MGHSSPQRVLGPSRVFRDPLGRFSTRIRITVDWLFLNFYSPKGARGFPKFSPGLLEKFGSNIEKHPPGFRIRKISFRPKSGRAWSWIESNAVAKSNFPVHSGGNLAQSWTWNSAFSRPAAAAWALAIASALKSNPKIFDFGNDFANKMTAVPKPQPTSTQVIPEAEIVKDFVACS